MKTAAERVGKWDRRYTGDRVKSIIDADKPLMRENATARVTDLVYYEEQTKGVLNSSGISVADTADYLAYSRQVWKCKNTYAGETLKKEVAVLIAKWVARGLTQSILQAIRENVYSISAPSAPGPS